MLSGSGHVKQSPLVVSLVYVSRNEVQNLNIIAYRCRCAAPIWWLLDLYLGLTVTLATRISVIVGDVLVLAVTWTKTAHVYREARKFGIGAHIATVLFRDGAMDQLEVLILHLLIVIFTGTIYFLCVILVPYSLLPIQFMIFY